MEQTKQDTNTEQLQNTGSDERKSTTENLLRLANVHPGDVLREDYMIPLGVTAYQLAKATHLSQTHVGDIIRGERGVTALTALRLSAYFGTSPELWLGLQNLYDLESVRDKFADELVSIPKHPRAIETERMIQEWEAEESSKKELVTA